MTTPPPKNEAERLAALRALEILDTPPEESFDELTALAAYICQTPMALISLIDQERQWFKSKLGVSLFETPRDISFCQHTVFRRDLFVVPDSLADPRFAQNPLVTSAPGIRFYAGVPLLTPEGHPLGAFAVMDHQPRELNAEQLQALRTLSRVVVGQIHSRRDLLERRRAEAALREQLVMTLRGSTIGIWQIDMPDGSVQNGRVEMINVWEMLGYDRPESATDIQLPLTLVHPDDRDRLMDNLQGYLEGTRGMERYDFEARTRHKDGSYRWTLSRGVAVRDATGKPIRMVGSTTDITDVKRAEEARRRANDRLDLAIRGSKVAVFEADMRDGVIENADIHFVNFLEPLGYDPADFPADYATPMALIHADDRPRVEQAIQACLSGETTEYEVESRLRHQDGSYRWLLSRGRALRDPTGKPIRLIGCSMDITDIKSAEEAGRESEQRFRTIVETANEGIWLIDTEARTRYMNARMAEILGYRPDEVTDLKVPDTWFPEDRGAQQELVGRNLQGEAGQYDVRFRRKDGSAVQLLACTSPVLDSDGRVISALGMFTDVTERKQAEEALRVAKEVAESANRAKDEFLANVSHEIRTPMNAILGMTELVLDTPLTEDQRQCLKTVKSAADNLLGIINDLLDFAKIEAGKLELDPADFSLRVTLGDTMRALAARAHRKGLELVCNVQPDVPDALVGDAGRLRQVLLNLVGNAIKFTEQGEVVMRVERVSDGVVSGESSEAATVTTHHSPLTTDLRIVVSDTGIGISPEKQGKIFRAFEQEDTSTTRKYGGTGLGLTIAARLVAQMAGTITVDSAPGWGSSFAFTARFGRSPHPAETRAVRSLALLRDLRVLVVDDNATNRRILVEWLRGWHMEPTAGGDAAAAMDALWHAVAQGRPYALVLLDARMPGMDGLALAAMIRQRAALAASRLILLTSGDRPGDLARYRELRIDAHLFKPVQPEELIETIYRVMSLNGGELSPGRAAVAPAMPAAAPLRILLAEDNEFNAQYLERLLSMWGHQVQLANNGREALALTEQMVFDLLLLDIHMPELDGFQVVRALRAREQSVGGHLPVIALTARSRKEDRQQCLSAGMDEYLSKPIRAADLFAAIDQVVSAHVGRMTKHADPVHLSSLILHPSKPSLLDPVVLLAACGGVANLLDELCQNLKSKVPALLAEIGDALRNQEACRLREAAHKLYGTITTFSTIAGELVSDLEDRAAHGQLDEARPLVGQLDTMVQEVMKDVDGLSLATLQRQCNFPYPP
jgi:PAS domain S-box-containing protein